MGTGKENKVTRKQANEEKSYKIKYNIDNTVTVKGVILLTLQMVKESLFKKQEAVCNWQ